MASRVTRRSLIALAVLSPVAIAACSGVARAPTVSRSPASSGASGSFTLGVVGSMSQADHSLALAMQRGSELAVADVNRQGVRGRKLTLVVADDHGDVATAQRIATSLVRDHGAVALVGPTSLGVSLGLGQAVNQLNTPLVAPVVTGTRLTTDVITGRNYIFRNALVDDLQAERLFSYALQQGYTRFAILAGLSSAGQAGAEAVLRSLNSASLPLAAYVPYAVGKKSYVAELKQVQSAKPDCVIAWGNGSDAARLRQAMQELKLMGLPFLACQSFDQPGFVQLARDVAEGTLLTQSFLLDSSPGARGLIQRYQAVYKTDQVDAPAIVAQTYDSVRLIAMALEQVGTGGNSLRQALENLNSYTGLVKQYSQPWTATQRDALTAQETTLAVVRSGRVVKQ